MSATTRLATLGGFGALALASSCVYAAPVSWSTPSGSNSQLSWANGQSDKGLFGDPVVSGSSFLFSPTNFRAESSNGVAQTTSDRLSVVVTAAPGKEIDSITIHELGDWSILGGGVVKAFGALYITKLNTPGFGNVWSDTLDVVYDDTATLATNDYVSPAKPNVDGDGTWDGTFYIDLPEGVTSVQLVLNNILQATSSANGTSFIEKKYVGDPGDPGNPTGPMFKLEVQVPEPASLSLIAMLGGALLRRQRNKSTNGN